MWNVKMSMLLNKCSKAELWCFYFQALVERGREERAHGIMGEVHGWGSVCVWFFKIVCVAGVSAKICVYSKVYWRRSRLILALNKSSQPLYRKWLKIVFCCCIFVSFSDYSHRQIRQLSSYTCSFITFSPFFVPFAHSCFPILWFIFFSLQFVSRRLFCQYLLKGCVTMK